MVIVYHYDVIQKCDITMGLLDNLRWHYLIRLQLHWECGTMQEKLLKRTESTSQISNDLAGMQYVLWNMMIISVKNDTEHWTTLYAVPI